MSQAEERRQILRKFVADNGGHAAVVREFRLTQSQASYLSQLITADSVASFGETSAKNWEERLKLPKNILVKPDLQDHANITGKLTNGTVDELRRSENHVAEPLAGYKLDNIRPVDGRRPVPLISWVQAGMWTEIQDNFLPGEAESWVAPMHSKPNGHAFALVVDGDSMTSPYSGGRSFPEGTVLIVDPDMGYGPGDFVIAKDVLTQQATFKQLTTDGGRWYLKPINPSYATMEIDDPAIRVIGRVCEFQLPGGKL